VFDVALDIRRDSASFRRWFGIELDPTNARGVFIAAGVAHGFLTLAADSDVQYQIDRLFRPGFDAGVRWDDPAFRIAWPAAPKVIGERDAGYPDYA
jgi:dTDP-4-dehydrorhamnose 3,5-epimerase